MKKVLTLILCLAMIFAMAGCGELEALKKVELPPLPKAENSEKPEASEAPAESPEAEAEPSAAPASETEAAEPVSDYSLRPVENPIMIRTDNTLMQEMDPDEGTQVILTYSYDTPSVYIEGRDEAAAKINEYLGLVDEAFYTGSDYGVGEGSIGTGYDIMLEAALDNFSYHYNNSTEAVGLEFSAIRSFETERADGTVLSFLYNSSNYMGGAYGNNSSHGFVFDSETGERLSLDRLSSDFDAFTGFIVEQMVNMAESEDYYKERLAALEPERYSEAFSAILMREDSWCFTHDGLLIFSAPEELGPHAAGIVEFLIPYAELEGKIESRYLPSAETGDVKFTIKPIEAMAGDTEIIDKLKVNEDGTEFCLIAEGNAYDVQIVTVSYSDRFFEMDELWYCSEMGGTALQVQTVIPEGIPNLMLKYRTAAGDEESFLISQSGKDGSFILIDDDIEVKG